MTHKINFEKKEKELTTKFEEVKSKLLEAEQVANNCKEELLRIQGEYRLLESFKKDVV